MFIESKSGSLHIESVYKYKRLQHMQHVIIVISRGRRSFTNELRH